MASDVTPNARACDVYAKQMMPRGYGYPLWHPELPDDLEIQIGDVGFLLNGTFWRIFNATKAEGDLSNTHFGVPDSYRPFPIKETLLEKKENVINKKLASRDIDQFDIGVEAGSDVVPVGAGMRFSCKSDQGAFLVIGKPARSFSLHPSRNLAHYIRTNIDKWHAFALLSDFDISKENLYFISGMIKTSYWGMGAFLGNGSSCEASVFAEAGSLAPASFTLRRTREHGSSPEFRSGPSAESERPGQPPPSPLPASDSQVETSSIGRTSIDSESIRTRELMDQCIFFHYYKVKKRCWDNKVTLAATEPESEDEAVEDNRHPNYDPVDALLDYILGYVMDGGSQVQVAVGSDAHLYDVFEGDFPKDVAAALEKMKPPVMFLDDKGEMGALACAKWNASLEFDKEERAAWADSERDGDTGKGRKEHNAEHAIMGNSSDAERGVERGSSDKAELEDET